MKYIKIIIGILLAIVISIISLSAYNQFINRKNEAKIDGIISDIKKEIEDFKKNSPTAVKIKNCKITANTNRIKSIQLDCNEVVYIEDILTYDKTKNQFVVGVDKVLDTLIFSSKVNTEESQVTCRLSWPLTKGLITVFGDVKKYGMCVLKVGSNEAWISQNEKGYFNIIDGTDNSNSDLVSFSQDNVELNWNDPQKSATLGDQFTFEISFELDSRQ